MYKKIVVALSVVFMMSALLCGCGGGVSQEEYDKVVAERDSLKVQAEEYDKVVEERDSLKEEIDSLKATDRSENESEKQDESDQAPEKEGESDEATVQEDGNVEILAEYTLSDGIGWFTRHFMVVQNNSSETVDISTSSLAYSEDGTMIGAENSSFDALGAGCTSVLYEAFEVEATIDHYETELNSSKSKYFKSVIQDLSFVQNDIDGGAVFQVTNNGEEAAEFVEGHALFFLNGELVGYDSTYFVDDDSELKPGETISKQMNSYEDFDTIEFYLTGRK